MKRLLITMGALMSISVPAMAKVNRIVPVCERSPLVQEALIANLLSEHGVTKTCDQITFEELATMDYFQIGFNDALVELNEGDLSGLYSIRFLYLNCNNNLVKVPGDLTEDKPNLRYFAIHTNPKLTSLPEALFIPLRDARDELHVLMSGNGLVDLPESIYPFLWSSHYRFPTLDGNPFSAATSKRIEQIRLARREPRS